MADTEKRLTKGTFSTTSTNVYTSPSGTGRYTIVKALTLCNKTASAATVTILFGGTEVVYQHSIKANDTISLPFMDQILLAGETISGLSATSNAINYYISGIEVTP